ncbi:DNA/RNA helicase domain-containing protein [Chryseomicrobium palamuruense]|uniref:DNA/RNA helicase domain-containing protein n=1 Tax=Chryseomicrobium palamuruense TaxID=682973 RepID=A0ABV8UW47_9BACL
MIIYEATISEFLSDIENEVMVDRLYEVYREKIGKTSKNEIRSWDHSLQRMSNVLRDRQIPRDAKAAIEFKIPNTGKRVDFIIAGNDGAEDHAVIVELKQWESVEKVERMDAVVVETYLGGGRRQTTHPSYQAWSYAALIEDFNEEVRTLPIHLQPCAYLHNYIIEEKDPLIDEHYQEHLEKAPVFRKGEMQNLRNFIKQYIKYGDSNNVIEKIENGRIRPSKSLQDSMASMLQGNPEFVMIDDQKIVYEQIMNYSRTLLEADKKGVFIVKGGPGTGKSVLAINLLVQLIQDDYFAMYVTKNSAPRDVYATKLKGTMKKKSIDNLFKGSGSFHAADPNEFDVLVVDEAHRLNEKSGLFSNLGENQVKELLNAAKFSVFFIDEAQRVTMKDIGSIDLIKKYANELGIEVFEGELASQFRCDGSDGYIAWLDDVLEIRETANAHDLGMDYDFRVIDSPTELLKMIRDRNDRNNKSRLVAGYCWEWVSSGKNDREVHDIVIEEHDFSISWNLGNDIWAIASESIDEAGCIHTCQGLEFDYVGVIIGDDLRYENGQVVTDYTKRAKTDSSIKGIKKKMKEQPDVARREVDAIIRNTYRTLMTRGQKGCYIYCTDKALADYFKSRLVKVYKEQVEVQEYLVAETKEEY